MNEIKLWNKKIKSKFSLKFTGIYLKLHYSKLTQMTSWPQIIAKVHIGWEFTFTAISLFIENIAVGTGCALAVWISSEIFKISKAIVHAMPKYMSVLFN